MKQVNATKKAKGLTSKELEAHSGVELLPDREEMRRHRRHRRGCQSIDAVNPDGTTAHLENC
jgi:hypothetical protein